MANGNRSNVTVTVGEIRVDAYSAHAGIAALPTEHVGMPMMGSVEANISFQIDLNDQSDPKLFDSINKLFDLCNRVDRTKIRDIKLEFWKDQSHTDVHLTMFFEGWVSSWHISSGSGANHVLAISLVPKLDQKQFMKMDLGN